MSTMTEMRIITKREREKGGLLNEDRTRSEVQAHFIV